MSYQGHIENGVVVFDEAVLLPNGTAVRIEPIVPMSAEFWRSLSMDELAHRQGVAWPNRYEDFLGGWPIDELSDGFEEDSSRGPSA